MATSRSKRSSQSRSSTAGRSGKKRGSTRRYGEAASKKVGRALHEAKHGTLRSGRSKKKVKSREQAIAIGLSEARRQGAKVPPRSRSSRGGSSRSTSSRSSGGRSSGGRSRGTSKRNSSKR